MAAALETSIGVETSSMAATCSVFACKPGMGPARMFMADQHIATAVIAPP